MKDWTISQDWRQVMDEEFAKPYFNKLMGFLDSEIAAGKTIFPPRDSWFTAFEKTPFSQVKAVIVGQDPYHGKGQAHGLSFSVQPHIAPPPSLVNIYKELAADLNGTTKTSGDLTGWAREGVLLLNSVLTVEEGKAGSHQNKGWERFTDQMIHALATSRPHLVFILWGAYAQKKCVMIDEMRHLVIRGPHPSPLSSYRGFFGSKPFSQANRWLTARGETPIHW